MFRGQIGEDSQLVVVALTLGIASLFEPLRRRVHGVIDRLFYRTKYDARRTLEAFSAKLRDETDLDALSNDLADAVRTTMQLRCYHSSDHRSEGQASRCPNLRGPHTKAV